MQEIGPVQCSEVSSFPRITSVVPAISAGFETYGREPISSIRHILTRRPLFQSANRKFFCLGNPHEIATSRYL